MIIQNPLIFELSIDTQWDMIFFAQYVSKKFLLNPIIISIELVATKQVNTSKNKIYGFKFVKLSFLLNFMVNDCNVKVIVFTNIE